MKTFKQFFNSLFTPRDLQIAIANLDETIRILQAEDARRNKLDDARVETRRLARNLPR